MTKTARGAAYLLLLLLPLAVGRPAGGDEPSPPDERPWERHRREAQDEAGGVPPEVLAVQSRERVQAPPLEEMVQEAWDVARAAALPLIDRTYHDGRRLVVPDDHETIQAAIDAARTRDVVVVRAGTYYELLTMKDGVMLVSDSAEDGDERVTVEGAHLRLPRRTLRTILDGSRAEPSSHGMIDFEPGTGRHTIVDGFTIQRLPAQDHHVPGHAHGLNVRGASPVIANCLIRENGSTGIGNHVVYEDQDRPIAQRDFRWANVKHPASAVIYGNVVRGSLGRGIGCNHFATPFILGNEVFDNADDETGEPGPGIGAKHGASPVIVGNVVHDNEGGGILTKTGAPQGAHPIDRRGHPTVERNVVYANGANRPAIGAQGVGTMARPVHIAWNYVYGAGAAGIGLQDGSVGWIEYNLVRGAGQAGIAVRGSTALTLSRNRVTGSQGPGFAIVAGSRVLEMLDNASDQNVGPRFVLRDSRIALPNR